jgi:hypothetical protein
MYHKLIKRFVAFSTIVLIAIVVGFALLVSAR